MGLLIRNLFQILQTLAEAETWQHLQTLQTPQILRNYKLLTSFENVFDYLYHPFLILLFFFSEVFYSVCITFLRSNLFVIPDTNTNTRTTSDSTYYIKDADPGEPGPVGLQPSAADLR